MVWIAGVVWIAGGDGAVWEVLGFCSAETFYVVRN